MAGDTSENERQPEFFSLQVSAASRFYLDLSPPARTALAVVSGGCEHCTPDYRVSRSTFPFFGLEFVARGRGALRLARRGYRLGPGTLFTYGKGIAHNITTDPGEPLVKYFVDFAGTRVAPLLQRLELGPGRILQTSAPGQVVALFDDLIREASHATPYTARIAGCMVEHLLLKIAETGIPHGSAVTAAFATYRRCREYIDANWQRMRDLQDIAEGCHIDPAYLCRLFQRFDHQGPYHCLQRLRMNHAARLLQEMGASVKQVAAELDFSDPFHFSRVFKRTMGASPSQFVRL
ncbi:MAG: AraC family transcriptional regulator, partial [Tepidisphaerales bacterium]